MLFFPSVDLQACVKALLYPVVAQHLSKSLYVTSFNLLCKCSLNYGKKKVVVLSLSTLCYNYFLRSLSLSPSPRLKSRLWFSLSSHSLGPFPVVGSEVLSSLLEPAGVTNGNTALPVAHSTNSKQSEGGERERRGVIRKRKEEGTTELNKRTCRKGWKLKVKRCAGRYLSQACVTIFEALAELVYS